MWQPIDTAPRDGRRLLLHPTQYVHDDVVVGYWSDKNRCWMDRSGVVDKSWRPSHWMPQPKPPKPPNS